MTSNVPIPELEEFEAYPKEQQRVTLMALRDAYSNDELCKAWDMTVNKFYRFIGQYDLPRKQRVSVENSEVAVTAEAERDTIPGTVDNKVEHNEETRTEGTNPSPYVPAPKVEPKSRESKQAPDTIPVTKPESPESAPAPQIDTSSSQVFEFVKTCNSEELIHKLKGLISLVTGEGNTFNVLIRLEENIPVKK